MSSRHVLKKYLYGMVHSGDGGWRGRVLTLPLSSSLVMLLLVLGLCGRVSAEGELRMEVPELCYSCHLDLKQSLSSKHVHFPFKQGKCIACHNSHAGNIKGMLTDDMNSLCLGCHSGIKALFKKGAMHGALKAGGCTDCHVAHAGPLKNLLVKEEKDLCWKCHESLKEGLTRKHVHDPFKGGQCSSCHNSHGSAEEFQMREKANKVCKNCHEPRCNVGGQPITFATKGLDCTQCHSGHASDTKGLLGPYGHSMFLDKACDQCHNPFASGKPVTLKGKGPDLCFGCHPKDPAKFKEDDPHWSVGENPCIACHRYHASKKKVYLATETGLCFTCHEGTARKIAAMDKTLKKRKGTAIKDRKCFECHVPLHSRQAHYLKQDNITLCGGCHKGQHEITHPLGNDVKDPRDGSPLTCVSCHSMHSPNADYFLKFDRSRQLCIQCHRR